MKTTSSVASTSSQQPQSWGASLVNRRTLGFALAFASAMMLAGCTTHQHKPDTASTGIGNESEHSHLPIGEELAAYIEQNQIVTIQLIDAARQVQTFDAGGHIIIQNGSTAGGSLGRCTVSGISRTCHLSGSSANRYHNATGAHAGLCPATSPCR